MTLYCSLSEIAVTLFRHVAGITIFLAMFILFKTNYDDNNSRDANWICYLRNLGFFAMAVMLGVAIWCDGSQLSLLGLFYSGFYSMAINVLALQLRK